MSLNLNTTNTNINNIEIKNTEVKAPEISDSIAIVKVKKVRSLQDYNKDLQFDSETLNKLKITRELSKTDKKSGNVAIKKMKQRIYEQSAPNISKSIDFTQKEKNNNNNDEVQLSKTSRISRRNKNISQEKINIDITIENNQKEENSSFQNISLFNIGLDSESFQLFELKAKEKPLQLAFQFLEKLMLDFNDENSNPWENKANLKKISQFILFEKSDVKENLDSIAFNYIKHLFLLGDILKQYGSNLDDVNLSLIPFAYSKIHDHYAKKFLSELKKIKVIKKLDSTTKKERLHTYCIQYGECILSYAQFLAKNFYPHLQKPGYVQCFSDNMKAVLKNNILKKCSFGQDFGRLIYGNYFSLFTDKENIKIPEINEQIRQTMSDFNIKQNLISKKEIKQIIDEHDLYNKGEIKEVINKSNFNKQSIEYIIKESDLANKEEIQKIIKEALSIRKQEIKEVIKSEAYLFCRKFLKFLIHNLEIELQDDEFNPLRLLKELKNKEEEEEIWELNEILLHIHEVLENKFKEKDSSELTGIFKILPILRSFSQSNLLAIHTCLRLGLQRNLDIEKISGHRCDPIIDSFDIVSKKTLKKNPSQRLDQETKDVKICFKEGKVQLFLQRIAPLGNLTIEGKSNIFPECTITSNIVFETSIEDMENWIVNASVRIRRPSNENTNTAFLSRYALLIALLEISGIKYSVDVK